MLNCDNNIHHCIQTLLLSLNLNVLQPFDHFEWWWWFIWVAQKITKIVCFKLENQMLCLVGVILNGRVPCGILQVYVIENNFKLEICIWLIFSGTSWCYCAEFKHILLCNEGVLTCVCKETNFTVCKQIHGEIKWVKILTYITDKWNSIFHIYISFLAHTSELWHLIDLRNCSNLVIQFWKDQNVLNIISEPLISVLWQFKVRLISKSDFSLTRVMFILDWKEHYLLCSNFHVKPDYIKWTLKLTKYHVSKVYNIFSSRFLLAFITASLFFLSLLVPWNVGIIPWFFFLKCPLYMMFWKIHTSLHDNCLNLTFHSA